MSKCYLCGAEINQQNSSKEHIVPNFLGGKIYSSDLLCKTCNNLSGEFENSLNEALFFFISGFNVDRDRGEIPSKKFKTEKGNTVFIGKDLSISKDIIFEKSGDGKFFISAPNKEKAKNILEGLKRKYPNIDIDELMNQAEVKTEYIDEPVTFELKIDENEIKAIVKIIVNYSIYKDINQSELKQYIDFIKNGGEHDFLKFYNGRSPFLADNNNEDNVLSVVSLFSLPKLRKLIGYIQIFDFLKFYIIIDENYSGKAVEENYLFYNENKLMKVDLNIFEENFDCIDNHNRFKEELNEVLKKILNKQIKKENARIVESSIKEIIPDNKTDISEEEIKQVLERIVDKFSKFYSHLRKN